MDSMRDDEQQEFDERGDETPRWPPFGSDEWRISMRFLHRDLRIIEHDANQVCMDINKAVEKLFREFRP